MAVIYSNNRQEEELRLIGYEVPYFPKSGPILREDVQVGYVDNFSGIVTRDKMLVNACFDLGMSVWNPDEVDYA